jgi:hypothetical protein
MGNLLGSLVWGAKSGQYCVIGGGSLQMVSEPPSNARSCGTGALHDVTLTSSSGI